MDNNCGVAYVIFGKQAQNVGARSIATLRQTNPGLPGVVVGDMPMFKYHIRRIPWPANIPVYNLKRKGQWRFCSGIAKPGMYDLVPFDRVLYLDCDTELRGDISKGFNFLNDYDIAIAAHRHPLSWYVESRGSARPEWEWTIEEWNNGGDHYWNTGAFFWRKSPATKRLFELWHEEWLRFKPWNEQLSFMRAARRVPELKVKMIPMDVWNSNEPTAKTLIFHNYGTYESAKRWPDAKRH